MQCHLPTTGMHVLDITEVVVHVLILLSDVHVHTCTAAKCSFVVCNLYNLVESLMLHIDFTHLTTSAKSR